MCITIKKKEMGSIYSQKTINTNEVFGNRFLDNKMVFLHCFNALPNLAYIGDIDGEKMFGVVKEKFAALILTTNLYRWYKHEKKKYQFDKTILVLNNRCVLEFDDNYCEVLHDGEQDYFIKEITTLAKQCKERKKKQPLEINLIVQSGSGMELKTMEIKRSKLNLDLFYEDGFKEVDDTICKRLNKKNDKGIVLLHGLPGTGKTTYLRYLIGKTKKRVLFLSPNVAGNLMNPDFLDMLIDNPNTILVIEDAENIIMDRRTSSSSAVSNLLNISDGLLADFLNVQLICTFNSSLTLIDNALLRKGRLIAKYEFGKLSIEKGQRLSNHLGFDRIIDKPMTVAEISSQHEPSFETTQVNVIGFRREMVMEN